MTSEDQERQAGLRRAGARAVRTGQVTGTGLMALLCAGALAPVVTAEAGLGTLGLAVTGLIGSVGGNAVTDVLTGVVRRLQDRGDAASLDQDEVERALAEAVDGTLAAGGEAGSGMRRIAAAVLRETGAVEAVLGGAASADPKTAQALATGLGELGRQFAEFAAEAGLLRETTDALHRELVLKAAEDREVAATNVQLALLVAQMREALDVALPARSPSAEAAVWPSCPYPGLAPFAERDAPVFFGRREMTRRLLHKVAERARTGGLLIVLGASGAGKSSLLRAGLVPALARDGLGRGSGPWPVRVITPGADPLADLAAPLAALSGGDSREILQLLRVAPERAAEIAAQFLSSHRSAAAASRPCWCWPWISSKTCSTPSRKPESCSCGHWRPWSSPVRTPRGRP